jgi:transketolase
VRAMPGSGKPAELLAAAGIDAAHIADAARELAGLAGSRGRDTSEVGSGRRE